MPPVGDAAAAAPEEYDLVVIGGGSGGLSCSKAAAEAGAKVACLDFVKPSPQGSTWGLGGTCVNVGCIPKKLCHQAALLGHGLHDAREYGWQLPEEAAKFSWAKMVEGAQNHIGSLNWGYRVDLREKNVKYLNAYGTFVDATTIKTVNKRGQESLIKAKTIVVAIGGRPRYPTIPGAELGITSDDIFSLDHSPGKTLMIGASYVALECAGFLAGMGFDTTVMVRSILLRGFDQQIAEKIGEYMAANGTKFIRPATPTKMEKTEDGKIKVTFTTGDGESSDVFDTVCFAIGRDACTKDMGLELAGVTLDERTGKIPVDDEERTNVPHIFALGDVALGKPELTPVAIQAGKLLARRLFKGAVQKMDYLHVPTTVFTPIEYGAVGYSEEEAVAAYGEDNVEVYHQSFTPLEMTVAHRDENASYCKLIVNKAENEQVVGLHILCPNAGEVTQGFAIALKMGATKQHFDDLVGIHPTVAENFTTLSITKSSGVDPSAKGC